MGFCGSGLDTVWLWSNLCVFWGPAFIQLFNEQCFDFFHFLIGFQQNMEIHQKIKRSERELEALERQEREVNVNVSKGGMR